ncbi:MAG: acetyl-coenzyme A synthetase N-terminal domain-containing protein, partial [Solirubrobacteraceae bacterium]
MIGEILWEPPADLRQNTEIGRFMEWLRERRGRDLASYQELRRWSVDDLEGFWAAIWDFFEIRAATGYERVLTSEQMPGAKWFEGARLNYAEHLLGREEDLDRVAVIAQSQT